MAEFNTVEVSIIVNKSETSMDAWAINVGMLVGGRLRSAMNLQQDAGWVADWTTFYIESQDQGEITVVRAGVKVRRG